MNQHQINKKKCHLAIIVTLTLMAFVLRVYHIERSPLRGDEAFAVRYWATPPFTYLATVEPHPVSVFVTFWLWKMTVGDTEFAMRILPALVNLLGVAAIFALALRLFRDERIAAFAGFLWAIDPYLIWHSQDVRNYAIWAALSVIALWLMVRAADRNRRLDWALYVIAAAFSLYFFFTEAFFILVHALYILLYRRRVWRSWLVAMIALAVLLIPWLIQIWALAHSPYKGTAQPVGIALLWTFWVDMIFGTTRTVISDPVLIVLTVLMLIGLVLVIRRFQRAGGLLTLLILVPLILLLLAGTRMNVLDPRYLLASIPAVLLIVSALVFRWRRLAPFLIFMLICVIGVSLATYFTTYHKAPDWYGLRDYLTANTAPDDLVIMTSVDPATGNLDPAFGYYYSGQFIAMPTPKSDTVQTVQNALKDHRAVWFIPVGDFGTPINSALLQNGMLISDDGAGRSYQVRQYRSFTVRGSEIDHALNLSIGGGTLTGYSLSGSPQTGSTLEVLLYWDTAPAANLTTFVHLIGKPNPTGSPLWAQEDHPPNAPGRDVYHLRLTDVPPGDYQIEVGMYISAEPTKRIQFAGGAESAVLTTIHIQGGS